jgi:hypothetical protein
MAWWIPLAMAAGGYVIDKQMGGDGTKGALLGLGGGAMLPAAPALASGTAAATTAGTVGTTGATMTGFGGAGGFGTAAGGQGLLGGTATAKAMGGYGSGSLGGMTGTGFSGTSAPVLAGSPALTTAGGTGLSNPYLGNAYPSSLTTGSQGVPTNNLSSLLTQGKDFVVDGFSDMSFADQLGVGMQAEGLLNRPTQRIQVDRPGVSQNKNAGYAKPYKTVVEGIPVPPEEEITEEEYYSLLRNK